MESLPSYSHDLIKALDEAYPNKYPELDTPDREIWFNAGQRSVINKLIQLLNQGADEGIPNILEQNHVL